jgi:phosphopantetheinyl transferase (holo-ACP synthase)
MTEQNGFELIRDQQIPELNSRARLYRHIKTGAELLSMENKDENKEAPAGDANKEAAAKAMKAQIAGQKEDIARLQRELDVAQREFKLQVANYYADAGNSLRDPKAWQDQSKKTQDEIAAKQEAVDKAKQKLADMQEAARKAGFPASVYE